VGRGLQGLLGLRVNSSIFLPAIVDQREIEQAVRAELVRWVVERREREAVFTVENVRFEHNPNWRECFWSMQNAHDRGNFVWKATGIVAEAMPLSWFLLQMLR
jgi:hypothetical protein